MKGIIQSMLEEIYIAAINQARNNNQTVGEKNDYYVTLEQLEKILKVYQD